MPGRSDWRSHQEQDRAGAEAPAARDHSQFLMNHLGVTFECKKSPLLFLEELGLRRDFKCVTLAKKVCHS